MSVRRDKYRDPTTGAIHEYWIVDVTFKQPNGKTKRIKKVSPVQTKRGAQQYEFQLRSSLLDGTYRSEEEVEEQAEERPRIPTVAEFAEEFLEIYVKNNNKPSEQASKRGIIDHHIKPLIGKVPLDQVGPKIEWFKAQLRERLCVGGRGIGHGKRKRIRKLGPRRINNVLAVMSKMLRYAAEECQVIPVAPRIRFLKVGRSEHDFLSFEEYDKLVAAAKKEPEWYPAILVAGDAGLRQGEIMALEWGDIDLEERTLTVRRNVWRKIVGTPKGGRERVIPLTVRLYQAFKAHRHLRGPRVFCSMDGSPLTEGKMQRPIERLCKRAGIRQFGWHTLRHTYCSHLGMLGAAPLAIQLAAGHQSFETTRQYIHMTANVLRDTIKKLDDRVAQTVYGQ